jgi:hypothetical protein
LAISEKLNISVVYELEINNESVNKETNYNFSKLFTVKSILKYITITPSKEAFICYDISNKSF